MVLTTSELVSSLQNEVRVLLHLAGKIDRAKLDYRPTPKQRSTLELLRYLSYSGPLLIQFAKGTSSQDMWKTASEAANARDFDQTLAAIAAQADEYAALLTDLSDADCRAEIDGFRGKTTRGSFLVNVLLSGCAAYRTQLFLYLKACGREELTTSNLWGGMDAPSAS